MKQLIVNADDFGLSPQVNAGIVQAHRDGLVTSASILANGPAFDEAAQLARAHPALDLGVHLNVAQGPPLSSPREVRSLLSQHGVFLGNSVSFALRLWLGTIRQQELVAEFLAQIRRVFDAGLRPTHLDTHLHLHSLEPVLRCVLAAAARFGIRRIRCPHETILATQPRRSYGLRSRFTSSLVRRLSVRARGLLERHRMRAPDHFLGTIYMGALDTPALVRILEALPEGLTELMTHPSVDAGTNCHISRDQELRALTSQPAKDAVRARSIQLVGYGAL